MNTQRSKARNGVLRNGITAGIEATCEDCGQTWTGPGAPISATTHVRSLDHAVRLTTTSTYRYTAPEHQTRRTPGAAS